jgi:four helix bundle protein
MALRWLCDCFAMAVSEMRDYRKLVVWQEGRKLALRCYRLTSNFPKNELYGLTSQIRRSAVSIPSNISEGVGRDSDAELLRSLRISAGSLNELETQMVIALDLGYVDATVWEEFESRSRDLGIRIRNLAAKIEAELTNRTNKRHGVSESRAPYGLGEVIDLIDLSNLERQDNYA